MDLTNEDIKKGGRERFVEALRKGYRYADADIPAGLRSVLGVLLMAAGVFGFLPILGFWMLPLGAMFIAMDIASLRRRLRRKLEPHASRQTQDEAG